MQFRTFTQHTINIFILHVHCILQEMKTFLAIAVITCLFVMGLAQTPQCYSQLRELSSQAGDNFNTFCNDCSNSLDRLFQDCTGGDGTDIIQQSKL